MKKFSLKSEEIPLKRIGNCYSWYIKFAQEK
jgi:hypothetical protein